METPQHKHDCSQCTFLGRYNEYDLYFCHQNGMPTIIARYGEAGNYMSGLSFAIADLTDYKDSPLAVGLVRAIERKLLKIEAYV